MEIMMGSILIGIFLVMMILMYLNKISALLALPIMAIAFTVVAGIPNIPWQDINSKYAAAKVESVTISQQWQAYTQVEQQKGNMIGVITAKWAAFKAKFNPWFYLRDTLAGSNLLKVVLYEGSLRLHEAYTLAFFGGMLAIFVRKKGIAEAVIRVAAELAGDKPIIVSTVLLLVCALLFITLGGLGAIIMIGSIIFPIMLSLGVPAHVAAGVMLIGLCTGGSLNPQAWVFYKDALGVPTDVTGGFAVKMALLYLAIGIVYIIINVKFGSMGRYWAAPAPSDNEAAPARKINFLGILTPLIPLFLILVLGWSPFPSFIGGLIWGLIFTWEKNQVKIFSQSLFEGAESVMPAVLLMIGIGMLLKAVTLPEVSMYLKPLLEGIIPTTPIAYIVTFTLFAPLALYRGPLNVWGMGSGLAGIMLATGKLPPQAIMAMLVSVGAIQGVCDPTNTHNVWIAGYLGIDVISITKKLIAYIWVLAMLGLVIAAYSYL